MSTLSTVPRTSSFADGATAPRYVTRAHGHSRGWMNEARCRGLNFIGSPMQHAWTTEDWERHPQPDGTVNSGKELIGLALAVCGMCPVQWDCTIWALQVEESFGTWGLAFEDLRWLSRQPDPVAFVEAARSRDLPVQVAVAGVRGGRRVA